MPAEVPFTPMAKAYDDLLKIKGRVDGRGVLERRLAASDDYLDDPGQLVRAFEQSVAASDRFFTANSQRAKPFFPARKPLTRQPGLGNTAEVSALFQKFGRHRWQVDDAPDLDFIFLERELVVTQARGLRLAGGRSTRLGPRMDLLLANADDGTPIVCELKVTSVKGSPDKDPFFALIQSLACASYLLPTNQLARLRHHDAECVLASELERVDVYVMTIDEPSRSRFWFKLRDRAEDLAEAVAPHLRHWVRRIAFIELVRPHPASADALGLVRATSRSKVEAVSPGLRL